MTAGDKKVKERNKEGEHTILIFRAVLVLVVGILIGYFVYATTLNKDSKYPFKLGLDLAGGSHLVYEADTSEVRKEDVKPLMNVLRDVIEKRINVFGVSEPIVQVEEGSFVSGEKKERLVVELPGVTDVDQAIKEIGKTPLLEFKLIDTSRISNVTDTDASTTPFVATGLTGRYLKRAELVFGQGNGLSSEPVVSIEFNEQGGDLFADITKENVGKQLAIFLDGEMVSAPRINESITGGKAVISGNFTREEARSLVQNLNFGALPLPISLVSSQSIGASLGSDILDKGVRAGIIGLAIVALFMTLWYRLNGLVAVVALCFYIVIVLALFKLIPVTLTAAGLAGLILSIGMAVDANVLVFERMKEEYRNGKNNQEAAREGFARAWSAIRDSNITSLLSAIILFWFGTSMVKGFALVFGIGVLASMLSAVSITRTFIMILPERKKSDGGLLAMLYESGIHK